MHYASEIQLVRRDEMETGYVKFFDTREGKLFGFLMDEKGVDLFFHYSGGRKVALNANRDIVFEQVQIRYPRPGDDLKFERGRNPKGEMAKTWCFEREYEEMLEKSKRDLTLEEARRYLADKKCNLLEYTNTEKSCAGAVITTVVTKITWLTTDGRYTAASGEFVTKATRYSSGGNPDITSTHAVSVSAPSQKFSRQTKFTEANALELKELGKPARVIKGKKQGVLWNGGWEEYVVDTNSVRDMTADELEKASKDSYPTFGDNNWLRCLFANELGHNGQAVRVLAHLGGGE